MHMFRHVLRGARQALRQRAQLVGVSMVTAVSVHQLRSECEAENVWQREEGFLSAVEKNGETILHRNFISRAAAAALPAVVNITTMVQQHTIFGTQQGMSAGSGFIVRDDGLVVTNNHVIHGNKIFVTLNDGRRFPARLVAGDSGSDIAVIQIEKARNLPVAKIGSSSSLKTGDFVVALGSPLNLSNSVTFGIVSNVARHGSEIGLMQQRGEFLQVDCAINQGNSGGPLVDLDGSVVGINTMKAQAADGISFAIPIDTAWQVVRQLLKHGRVARPFIGFKMVVLLDSQGIYGPPGERKVVIAQIVPNSPAEKAGVKPGDVILEFDGKPVAGVPDILAAIGLEANQRIPLTVLRSGDDAGRHDSYSSSIPRKIQLTIVTESQAPGHSA